MTDRRWTAPPADAVVVAALDLFTALYHRPSGQTHLLVEPAPQILAMLAEHPATLAELQARLADRYALEDADALAARLDELADAGLVSAA